LAADDTRAVDGMTAPTLTRPFDVASLATGRQFAPILVVDDSPAKRLALRAVLTPLGFPIVEADSGATALRHIMAQDFAVILLDVRMPLMDGFETAALIRKRRQSEMTPIIFFTAYSSDEIANTDHYAEGAVDFMFAPVPPEEIRAKVSVFANLFIKAEILATRARGVQTSADQLRLLTDAAPIGIFQVDAQGRYEYTNPRWTEIVGIPADQAAGRAWDSIVDLESVTGRDFNGADRAPGQAGPGERFTLRLTDGTTRTVLVTWKPISDGAGGIAGYVGTVADVSADAAVEAAMSDARDRATEASRLKSDFLANMSHEIRTPMNGVIGMTDLLLETDLDARQREYAQTVRNSGEALLTIIDDILDFSKVEAGKVEIENIDFSVQGIVHDVVDLLAGSAQSKGLELMAVTDKLVPAVVIGDPGRVRQVLTNLVGNAIKFTQVGDVCIRVTSDESPGDHTVLRFEVTDTGDGVEADKLAVIFQPFVQADTSTSRKYGGTGLGLAISGQLVALMSGDCGVSSQVGEGSTFWFTVDVKTDARHSPDDLASQDAGLAGVVALIVDDNAAQRGILHDYLTDWGMSATTAASGEAALTLMRAAASDGRPFKVVVVDRSMPDMDGLALNDAIAGDPALTAPVVLLTGLGQQPGVGDAAESGIRASLSKPVHRDDLRTCLRTALGVQLADAATTGTPSRPSRTRELASGRLLLAEDNPINQKVAVAILTGAGYVVDTVSNGQAAVEAVADGHYDVVLMDCQMPELSGYEATAAIRVNDGTDRHTPIIALTAGARPEDRERCLAEGMDSYLAKPLNKDVLLALVAKTMNDGPTTTDPLRVGHTATAEIMIDAAVLAELFAMADGGEPEFLANLVDQFARETESRLIELREAFETDNAPAVGRIAHLIQGSACQLGGRRLAVSCDRLEGNATRGSLSDAATDLQGVEMDYQDLSRALKELMAPTDDRHFPCLHG
jgi:two-component system sensor histidine kinase/response regulator